MILHVKNAGVWKPTKKLWTKQAGAWTPVRRAFVKQGGVWKQYFQDEVVATITVNTIYANAANYFSAADWANPLIVKRLIIAPSVHCWSAAVGSPGLHAGYGRGGKLIIENHGYILGAGGAVNSGEGGFAFYVDTYGVSLINHGGIYGGGGGGGRGGDGGRGYFYTARTATEGPVYQASYIQFYTQRIDGVTSWSAMWYGTSVGGGTGAMPASVNYGGSTYYPHTLMAHQEGDGGANTLDWYSIYRTYVVNDVFNLTAGGIGGNGGRGYGYDPNLTPTNISGTVGTAGGTNAGAGGTGGHGGGNWGAAGNAGAQGGYGNNDGYGLAGAAGGLAGHYIYGYSFLDHFSNTGTVLGRVA